MNYLAHLRLAENNHKSIIGNLLGDFVKGRLENYSIIYYQSILKGIITHSKVDIFTDKHPIYLISKRRISSDRSRFAGIIIDLIYDYFLANNWDLYSEQKLSKFINDVYSTFNNHYDILPSKLQKMLPMIIKENWLLSYKNIDGIALAFQRLSRRFKRENSLLNAEIELINNYEELEQDFNQFFPQLITFVEDNRVNF